MSQKKPLVDRSTVRPQMDECLPLEVLEEILGLLDRETLCTARLVSRALCAAAALHIRSIKVTNTQAVSSHRFSHLRDVTVNLNPEGTRLVQLDPRLLDLTTTLTVKLESEESILETLAEVPLMPKLRTLDVRPALKHGAALLRSCTNLEALCLHFGCSTSVAMTIVTMTQLTSLVINNWVDYSVTVGFPAATWLELAKNLSNLQELHIITPYEHLALIGNLTSLTGLTMYDNDEGEPRHSIAPLTRVTRLRSLDFGMPIRKRNLRTACSLGLGSLVNLGLWAHDAASDNCGRFLSRQTALTRLTLYGPLSNLRHIGALRIELLRSLDLYYIQVLDAEGLSVLCRITSLTELTIGIGFLEPQRGLSRAMAQLTQLRSLRLICHHDANESVDFHVALSPLTSLTKLEVRWQGLDDGALGALVALTGLRMLELADCALTDDGLPQLKVLTNLEALLLYDCGVTSLAPIIEVLDPLRKARGLRPLHTIVDA